MMGYDDHDQGEDDRHGYDDEDDAGERCSAIGVMGACDEPADMHCPTCGRALCFACAREHTRRDAPACGRGHPADASTAPHSFGRSLFGEQRDDA
jgi:hypothetical protein